MRMVLKFGGTSLGNLQRVRGAVALAAGLVREGHQVVVVVSAQGDTTDVLLHRAEEITPAAAPRELDAYLAVGEQLSAAQMAMALISGGTKAVSLTGWQAGIQTDGIFGNARILRVQPERILAELAAGNVVVVAGFQGVDADGNVTTLGRGGSDTTAVAIAAAIDADCCRIYTDVDGVYDADPRTNPHAKRYDRIGYDAMLALARSGAQVLHDRCVELARQKGVVLEVRSSFTDEPGTTVMEF